MKIASDLMPYTCIQAKVNQNRSHQQALSNDCLTWTYRPDLSVCTLVQMPVPALFKSRDPQTQGSAFGSSQECSLSWSPTHLTLFSVARQQYFYIWGRMQGHRSDFHLFFANPWFCALKNMSQSEIIPEGAQEMSRYVRTLDLHEDQSLSTQDLGKPRA